MQTFFRKLTVIFTDKAIRNRILFVLGALVIFRLLAAVPIPGTVGEGHGMAASINTMANPKNNKVRLCFAEAVVAFFTDTLPT